MAVSRQQVLRYRLRVQQLDATGPRAIDDVAALDLGVQDTGPDGGRWALANRGVEVEQLADLGSRLALAWTLRGAPHLYRRREIAEVAAAVSPFSEADAAKRVFDAAKPLREAGIDVSTALDVVAGQMRDIVRSPTVKGEMSTALTGRLEAPYLRYCRSCRATHTYEQPFRLAALRAGLELVPGTSPPVLTRIPRWTGPAERVPAHLDVVRAYLHLLGPATPAHVAGYLDAPVREVKQHWPDDAVEVDVDGERRWVLDTDRPQLESGPTVPGTRLLGPFDLFLQARDRELLVPDARRRRELWVVLGRPGAVVVDGEIVGTWRPRASGRRLAVTVDAWVPPPETAVAEQGEQLAAVRGLTFAGVTSSGVGPTR